MNGIPRPEPGSAVVTQEMGPQVGRQIIRRWTTGGWVGHGSWTIGGLPDHQGWASGGWMCVSGEPQVGRWVMGQVALDGSSDYQVFILCPRILRTFGLFFKWSNKLLNRSSKFIQRLVRIITVLRVGSTFKRVT